MPGPATTPRATHHPSPASRRGNARDRSRSSCRGRRPSCDATRRDRRPSAAAGGTTRGSAARRRAASARARRGRCGSAPRGAPTARGGPATARKPAAPLARLEPYATRTQSIKHI